jgi:2-keto-4-pentenoate hydratase
VNIATSRAVCLLCLCCLLPRPLWAWSTLENWADVLLLQLKARQPLPALSGYGAGLDLADAYAVQGILRRELAAQSPLVGFRAELTSPLAQVRMRANGPVFSGVFKRDLRVPGGDFGPAKAGLHSIAPALGFVFRKRIAAPLDERTPLSALVARIVPVVLVYEQRFENRAAVRIEDLVAANGGHAQLVIGRDFAGTDPAGTDGVFVEVLHHDNVIERGKATNVMGGQVRALRWLIGEILARGEVVVPGQVLVTGPMFEPMPIVPGSYVVDFWDHQRIPVTLLDPDA